MTLSPFLRRILMLDGASCLAMGALLALAASPFGTLFSLDRGLVAGAGLALLPVGVFILWLGSRRSVHPALIWAVIAGNLLWSAESLVTIGHADTTSPLGTAFVAAQAAFVAGLSLLEWIGLRRSRAEA
jgi:hypothetical protein